MAAAGEGRAELREAGGRAERADILSSCNGTKSYSLFIRPGQKWVRASERASERAANLLAPES